MSDLKSAEPLGRGSWLRVANLMGYKPELAALRKFQKLNVLRLLEMQSELAQQEREYELICSLDAKVDCPATQSYSRNWKSLNESRGLSGSRQRDAWRNLRNGLESYSECKSTFLHYREVSLRPHKTWHCYSRSRSLNRIDPVSMT